MDYNPPPPTLLKEIIGSDLLNATIMALLLNVRLCSLMLQQDEGEKKSIARHIPTDQKNLGPDKISCRDALSVFCL